VSSHAVRCSARCRASTNSANPSPSTSTAPPSSRPDAPTHTTTWPPPKVYPHRAPKRAGPAEPSPSPAPSSRQTPIPYERRESTGVPQAGVHGVRRDVSPLATTFLKRVVADAPTDRRQRTGLTSRDHVPRYAVSRSPCH
jgi:hypothetical protein